MKSGSKSKRIATETCWRLVGMIFASVVLLAINAAFVQRGFISEGVDLNVVAHFIVVALVNIIATAISKNKNGAVILGSVGLLYLLWLFVAIVVLNGVSLKLLYGMIGGITGAAVSLYVSFKQNSKRKRWKQKRHTC